MTLNKFLVFVRDGNKNAFICLLLNSRRAFPASSTERGSSCCSDFSLEDLGVLFFRCFRRAEGLGAAPRIPTLPFHEGGAGPGQGGGLSNRPAGTQRVWMLPLQQAAALPSHRLAFRHHGKSSRLKYTLKNDRFKHLLTGISLQAYPFLLPAGGETQPCSLGAARPRAPSAARPASTLPPARRRARASRGLSGAPSSGTKPPLPWPGKGGRDAILFLCPQQQEQSVSLRGASSLA